MVGAESANKTEDQLPRKCEGLLDLERDTPRESRLWLLATIHLPGSLETVTDVALTVQDIRQFDLREIIPGHCTGWRAVYELIDVFGEDRVIASAMGQSHHF